MTELDYKEQSLLQEEASTDERGTIHYFFKCLFKSPSAVFGASVIFILIVIAITAPWIAPNDPASIDLAKMLRPPSWVEGGEAQFLLGTDALGRCILSRIVFGARISLLVGFAAVFLAGFFGVTLGLLAGYIGGIVDDVIMRITEVFMAFPFILLSIAIMTVLGSGVFNLILAVAVSSWTQYARLIRSEVIVCRNKEYIEASKVMSIPQRRVLFKHIFPNVISSVIVIASFSVASSILSEAALSFLGVGVSPTIPSWGAMIAFAQEYIYVAWWMAVFPGIAIVLTVLGINLFGDWLRDFLDPKTLNY